MGAIFNSGKGWIRKGIKTNEVLKKQGSKEFRMWSKL